MRRTLPARAGVALLALTFLLVVNGPAALYQCPAHSPRAASGQTATMPHGAHAHHAAPADQKAPHCTCGGMCCCCPPAAGLPAFSAHAEWFPSVRTAVAVESRLTLPRASRSLPFPTGPPPSA